MKRLSWLLIGLVVLAVKPAVADVIYVSGDQTGTWSADTVIVTGEVRVPPGQTLTIMPGVEIYFWTYCKFIVDSNATLLAVGTQNDSILFNEHWAWPTNGWHGIRFLSASNSSRLEFCHLTNGYAGGSGQDGVGGAIYSYLSSPTIQNCLIDSCIAVYGGAMYCDSLSNAAISGNNISGNSACDGWGGAGIYCYFYSSPTISGNTISGNSGGYYGGGISCYNSSPTISSNTINGNSGGGIFCEDSSSPTISNNTINLNSGSGMINCNHSNPTISSNTINGNLEVGIYCDGYSSPTISNNTISGNSGNESGGIECWNNCNPTISNNTISGNSGGYYGGGIGCYHSSPTISNNAINGNSAYHGGGICCDYNSSPTINSNTIIGNYANYGGGIALFSQFAEVKFNEISQNTASSNGGGIYTDNSDPSLNKNTIADNTAALGGGIYSTASNPTFINCILWANAPEQIYQTGGSIVQATYCDIGQYWLGTGNINADPFFVDPANSDYHLQSVIGSFHGGLWLPDPLHSPCIDAGNPNSPFANEPLPNGDRINMGFEGNTAEASLSTLTSAPLPIAVMPREFRLSSPYPNPFNPTTNLSYELLTASFVSLKIYDTAGRLVAELVNGWRDAGKHEITFDAAGLASGVYLVRLAAHGLSGSEATPTTAGQKLVLLK